jgi:hypothetical protein
MRRHDLSMPNPSLMVLTQPLLTSAFLRID